MNTLKKFVQGQTSASPAPSNQTQTPSKNPAANSQDYALSLQHLKRVFQECLSKSGGNISLGDDRLYSLVPIFVKLFKSSPVEHIQTQFSDLPLFATAISRLLVHEIKKRAGDRSAEGASSAIVDFLLPSEFSHGWMLLLSLQTISACSGRLADMICATTLPSTLVKSFYLFFDLPAAAEGESELSRQTLASATCEILCNLLRSPCGGEELAKRDDLALLFIAASSPCPPHNSVWRQCCQEALCVMARHSLTPPVLGYIHSKGCLKICVDNMRNIHQLKSEEIFGIFQYVAVFLQHAFDKSQTMVDDFRVAQGFVFIVEFGLRLGEETGPSAALIEQLIAIIKDLTGHGPSDLKPQLSQSPFRQVSFHLPRPKGPPFSIRNLDTFQTLQDLFLRTSNPETAKCILLAINELCVWDEANYFLMDYALSTLSLFTGKVVGLSEELQNIYFNLLRHVVIELNHVPCKELASLALVVRDAGMETGFFKLALVSLKRILFHDITFQDVYRDVGLLEVLTRKFIQAEKMSDFPFDLLDVFHSMLKQNNQNCPLFREAGGSQHLLTLVLTSPPLDRQSLLTVLQHLLTSLGCDDDMQHLLTTFNSTRTPLPIKQDLLRCLCGALRESHRSRIAFRKSGAFVSLVSAIVALEGQMKGAAKEVFEYLGWVFETLTTAMRYEPSNAKHFQTEIRWSAMTDALRLLGCFANVRVLPAVSSDTVSDVGETKEFSDCFFHPEKAEDPGERLQCCVLVFRCLYLMALDGYRHGWADNFEALLNDAPIVHAGAVLVILDLLPAIPSGQPGSTGLLIFISEVLKSLVRHERNQQLMCEANFVHALLIVCEAALADEQHPLNACSQYILERLAAQSLRPRELRSLLRLRFWASGGQLPLSRIKTLVSMITLRDRQSISPPAFVEFDLSYEGFGGLYLPSIAPQSVAQFALHGSLAATESAGVTGGIGGGLRVFPPAGGLSVVMWFCVDSYAAAENVRLMDITRHLAKPQDNLTCLSVSLLFDGQNTVKLLVSTREHNSAENPEVEISSDTVLVDVSMLKEQEGVWHCVMVSLGKTLVKSGYCNIYLDNRNLGQYKLTYIPQNPGGGAAHLATASSISATIGTQPIQRKSCKLRWRLANMFMLEEPLTPQQVNLLFSLGPNYHGNFQDPQCAALNLQDDKVLLGLNPLMVTEMSVAKIRRIYNKDDAKAIAKHLALSSHDASTPVKLIHNSAAHLRGPARGIGSAVVGYLGVRLFSPKPAHQALLPIGGIWSLLGMVAMAPDTEYLYAAMKCLFCALRTNYFLREQMISSGGFQFVAMMLKKKKDCLNAHVLHLAFSMMATGSLNTPALADRALAPRESSTVYDRKPLEDLLSDLQLWQACTPDLQRSLFEHFIELSKEHNSNARLMCETGLVRKLLQFLINAASSDSLDSSVLLASGELLRVLLRSSGKSNADMLSFAQYMICTIPSSAELRVTAFVALRNTGLQLLRSLCETYPDLMANSLGFDFLLSFLHPALHLHSIVLVLDMLTDLLLINANNLSAFREARNFGSWLRDSAHSRRRTEIGRLIPSHQASLQANLEVISISGFHAMQLLMPELHKLPMTWMSVLGLFVGRRVDARDESESSLTLDNVWLNLFSTTPGMAIKLKEYHIVCPEAVYVLLAMARSCCEGGGSENANCLLQVLIYMYHNWPEFALFALTLDFVAGLAICLFTSSEDDPQFITKVSNTRRLLLDLLRMLVTDSLALPGERSSLLTDAWLESAPETTKTTQVHLYQAELASVLMEHIMALNLIVDTSGMWIHPAGHRGHVPQNVFALAHRLVDKLWRGALPKLTMQVLEFLIFLLTSATKSLSAAQVNESSSRNLEAGFSALNRLIIFQISRPTDTISSQMAVLDALHKIVDHRSIVFHAANQDPVFLGSLAYCLSLIIDKVPINCEVSGSSTWHAYPELSGQIDEGWGLLQSSAGSVWNVMVKSKGAVLRDVMRPPKGVMESDLGEVKEFVRESTGKVWTVFLESCERRPSVANPPPLSGMNIAAVRKALPNSLVRAYSRQKSVAKPPPPASGRLTISPALFLHQLRLHCLLVNQYTQDQLSHLHRALSSLNRLVEDEWLQCETEYLLRERSLWGPEEPWKLAKWMLDMSEGPQRVRRKMVENVMFFEHYAWRGDVTGEATGGEGIIVPVKQKLKYPVSADSRVYFEDELEGGRIKTLLKTTVKLGANSGGVENGTDEQDGSEPKVVDDVETESKEDDDLKEEQEEEEEEESDDTIIRRLMEEGDTINYAFRCARVEGLDAFEGLMLFGRDHFYLIDGYTLLSTREIRDIESIPPGQREPVLPSVIVGKRRRQKFNYDEIREVIRRRYLLQQIGIEIFCTNGRTNLLAFPRDISQRVYSRLLAIAPNLTDSANLSVAGQKRGAQVEPHSGLLSSLIGETSVTQRWVRGEISNFQYLMFLNTLAGRSYNDLMQYPVFPWILADYDSPVLDLTDPTVFRDLSKPMGAQTEDRLHSYMKRYREWDPNTKDTPFFYGTHYSTAMIVASYLLRLEPFTQYFLHLQGGNFDLADRMFHSVGDAWMSAAKNNMADVKELIPEFFYLPDFLLNANKFDLGTKQSGVQLDDVVLPAWAKNDAREFIRVHREALECDYVSAHLHEWIDLIFGYKQQGPAAVDAINLFHGWMYEGAVDLDKMTDPLEKQAFIAFINNFGQVPSQIFKKPHPVKKISSAKPEYVFHNVARLQPTVLTGKELRSPVGHIIPLDKSCLPIEQNKAPILPACSKYLAWGFPDHSLRICALDSDRPVTVYELRDEDEVLCAVCPSSDLYLVAGMSGVIAVYGFSRRLRRLNLAKHLYGHYEPVTCLAASAGYSMAVSGSKDRTCIVWDLQGLAFLRQLRGHPLTVSAVAINDLTGDIGSAAGTWLFYWDINGHLLTKLDVSAGQSLASEQILCIAFSQAMEWDPLNVIVTGGNDGCVRLWSEELVKNTGNNPVDRQLLVPGMIMAATAGEMDDDTEEDNVDPVITMRRLSIHGSVSAAAMGTRGSFSSSSLQPQDTEDLPSPSKEDSPSSPSATPSPRRGPRLKSSSQDADPSANPSDLPSIVLDADSTSTSPWQRKLTLRTCINLHNVLGRKGGAASVGSTGSTKAGSLTVTALAFSKDHKALHVGDSQGRVTTWLSNSGW